MKEQSKIIIGKHYRYAGGTKKFKLVCIVGYMFMFECGHGVTDCVFEDMVCVDYDIQLSLF